MNGSASFQLCVIKIDKKMENKSKIALVTGGGRGLGRDMALKIAEKGIDVVLTYVSREASAKQVADQVRAAGRKAAVLRLDVGNVRSFEGFAQQLAVVLKDGFGADGFDFLVNNGGIGGGSPS